MGQRGDRLRGEVMARHAASDDPPTEPIPTVTLPARTLVVPAQVQRLAWLTPVRRLYFYRVLAAVIPLLVLYGALDAQAAALWVAAASAVLGMGLAAGHVNRGGGR